MAQIVTKTGENTITFDAYYQFMWCINYGDTDVYVSNHNDIVAGDDDVIYLPSGAAVRVNVNGKTLYVLGSTTLEVHAQNYSTEPIASTAGSGGGGSITIDPTPTQGSSNAVSSGGVYTALQNVPQPVDYSTTEQNTGRKWIDGKPIYQKTFVKTEMGEYVGEKPANLETIVSAESVIHYTAGDDIIIPVYATGGNDYYNFYFKNNNLVLRDPTSGMINVKAVITIYYTKTTDTAG